MTGASTNALVNTAGDSPAASFLGSAKSRFWSIQAPDGEAANPVWVTLAAAFCRSTQPTAGPRASRGAPVYQRVGKPRPGQTVMLKADRRGGVIERRESLYQRVGRSHRSGPKRQPSYREGLIHNSNRHHRGST